MLVTKWPKPSTCHQYSSSPTLVTNVAFSALHARTVPIVGLVSNMANDY